MRVGIGYDVHQFVEGRKLILGGVDIPFEKGLLGHSDADALLHAISDALLGAANLGDIGVLFPDNDPAYKNADSSQLLAEVYSRVENAGWKLGNLDAVILAQHPKMRPHIPKMVENIARLLRSNVGNVSIKATTTEKLGYVGREEGVAAQAIALLSPVN